MRVKSKRQEVIKMIVSSEEIATQEELQAALKQSGYICTQATLSRDLRQMHITKAMGRRGRTVYVLPHTRVHHSVEDTQVSVNTMHRIGVLSIKFSGTMAVVKTLPGYAPHVAYDIDNAKLDCILGTVAGDDTVFVVLAEGTDHSTAIDAIGSAANYPNKA